jgi:predicted ribosome quality control (RQC) complex YloA/Tae2 family protein
VALIDPWERVLDWQFSQRPGDPVRWHLYLEVMGRYSNAVMVDAEGIIFACGHGVSERQSSVRPVQPGLLYQPPPALLDPCPTLMETQSHWQEHLSLIPGSIKQRLIKSYRGLSTILVESLLQKAGIQPETSTQSLDSSQWQTLFLYWRKWLEILETGSFQPGWTEKGYTVLGWQIEASAPSIHELLESYYSFYEYQETFYRERQKLQQKLKNILQKMYQRRDHFHQMLQQSEHADTIKDQADLLMAHLHAWQPGLSTVTLPSFLNGDPVTIPLDPEKNATSNAQALYKKHRKQKRARERVLPLWEATQQEVLYLEQIDLALDQLDHYQTLNDLEILKEIESEFVQQGYLTHPNGLSLTPKETHFRRYSTPSGGSIWVGRNNRQNDLLTLRFAQDSDWWFHAQEIPGSHVLLRLPPGEVPDESDLQTAANLAAYFSRARLSEQVPVVYTRPKHIYKPKGSLPGMVIYKHEKVIWAQPNNKGFQAMLESYSS